MTIDQTEARRIAAGLSEEELRQLIRSKIGFVGAKRQTAKSLAAQWGVSQGYLSDVLNGHRGIADKLANSLGYDRVVVFVPHAILEADNA